MKFYFNHPRFKLSSSEDALVRFLSFVLYLVLILLMAWFILYPPYERFFWIGAFFALFLISCIFRIGKAPRSLQDIERNSYFFSRLFRKKESFNLAFVLTPYAEQLLLRAYRASVLRGVDCGAFVVEHSLDRRGVREMVVRSGVSYNAFAVGVRRLGEFLPKISSSDEAMASILSLVSRAHSIAVSADEEFIDERAIFSAVFLRDDSRLKNFLSEFAVSSDDFREAMIFGRYKWRLRRFQRLPVALGGFASGRGRDKHRIMNRSWTARPTPNLDAYGTDLTHLARKEQLGFLVGHNDEFSTLLDTISRPGKPNVLLVGEPGVGKTELVHYLAFRIIKDRVPKVLFDKRLVSLEIGGLLAEGSEGEVGERVKLITDEIISAGNVVIFIPDIHNLFKFTGDGVRAPIDYFLPIIKGDMIPVIGETYPREFKRYIEPRTDFLDQFQTVRVNEMSESEAIRYLVYFAIILEKEFGVMIVLRAIRRAVEISSKYFREKPLPASASDLLRECFAQTSRRKTHILDEHIVTSVAEDRLDIPIRSAEGEEVEKLLNLEDVIHKRLINQNEAVSAVSNALREYRSGLSRQGGPIATFLFVGPTGVGKTELAKILAKVQFGSRDMIHRFDMSEYQDRQSIFRLVGTPDGERTGDLADAVREKPYGIVLLDEFEKAHSDVLNVFLQVFDDGRLTDSLGRVVNFEHCIIIATSNAHSDFIKDSVEAGSSISDISIELKRKLSSYFRPELINRFSDIVVFRNLTVEEIAQVAQILMSGVAKLLDESHGISLTFTNVAVNKIGELGYSNVFGARLLRKVISQKIRSPIANMLLRGEIQRGDILKIDFNEDKFAFIKK